jgi:hypothetical protein
MTDWIRTTIAAAPFLLAACDGTDSCFVGGTLVATPNGPRAIESLRPGDLVWSHSFEEGRSVARAVVELHCALEREVRRVAVAGETMIRGMTPSHPVYFVEHGEFRPASRLAIGDVLMLFGEGREPSTARVTSIEATEAHAPSIEVFNLSVEGPEHNYFADGVLVHNKEPVVATCDPSQVKGELVENGGKRELRVTVPEGSVIRNLDVSEDLTTLCNAASQVDATLWRCVLTKDLGPGPRVLSASGSISTPSGGCSWSSRIDVVVSAAAGDAGAGDAGD